MSSEYLDVALRAVKEAEGIILEYLDKDMHPQIKSDLSPVTIADQKAEQVIRRIISDRFPEHTFYGEEGGKTDLTNHQGYTWIIDPIDETKSYMRRNPLFATQLALMCDGELILGVSNAPKMGEMLYAEKGKGCYCNGEKVCVSEVGSPDDSYVSFGSLKYFERTGTQEQLLQLASHAKWARGIGDFWSYHLLAQGKIDVMIEPVTKLWDVAALSVIVTEAGGRVSQMNGARVSPGMTSCIATNGLLHEEIVKVFN